MAEQTGSSETAIVEQAIFFYSQMVVKTVQGRQRSLDWQAARKRREAERAVDMEPTEDDLNSVMEQAERDEYQEALRKFPALKGMYAGVPNHPKRKKRRRRK